MGQNSHKRCQSRMFWWGSEKAASATREHPQQEPPTPSDPPADHPPPSSQSAPCLATFQTSGRVSRLLEEAGYKEC